MTKTELKYNDEQKLSYKFRKVLFKNMVTIIFIILSIIGIQLSGLPIAFIASELVTRLTRNSFLVLSLIIPVLAGMGLNFSIVVGAMAGQVAIIAVTHWGITGLPGFLLCALLAAPLAILFGFLTGKLLNKTRGQEMIASMIVGFFANGIYQLVFLFLVGKIIPMKNPVLILNGGVGVRNTIDLSGGVKPTGIKYALDGIFKYDVFNILVIVFFMGILYYGYKYFNNSKHFKKIFLGIGIVPVLLVVYSITTGILFNEALILVWLWVICLLQISLGNKKLTFGMSILPTLYGLYKFITLGEGLMVGIILSLGGVLFVMLTFFNLIKSKDNKKERKYLYYSILFAILMIFSLVIINNQSMLSKIKLPVITVFVIMALCLFNLIIVKTKVGQDFRTVGQDKHIAKIAGINVSKTRVLAITISTLLAAWGQLIFLQNLGTLNTYGSHEQIGMFSIAALLIGGATVSKATIGQAILGTALFHILFIVSPLAGKNLFGDAQIGEFFRVFVVYGVIGLSLGLHAWKTRLQLKNKIR